MMADSNCNHEDDHEDQSSNSCGLCSFRPAIFQKCANKKAFLAVFCITSVLQGIFYTYFVSVLTTIEKLYQIRSTTTGMLMSAAELGQICGVLWLTYYGGQGNRPKWIACGMLVFSFAVLLASSPHFLFNNNWQSSLASSSSNNSTQTQSPSSLGQAFMESKLCASSNSSVYFEYSYLRSESKSTTDSGQQHHSSSSSVSCSPHSDSTLKRNHVTNTVLGIFFFSVLLVGIGSTATNTLGIPYIDDNVAQDESPLYFGITIGIKIFGPVFGFLLGSLCTNISVNFPSRIASVLTPSDPQWVGAWWLGMVILGFAMILVSFMMMSFPKNLRKPPPKSPTHNRQDGSTQCRTKPDLYLYQDEPMLERDSHEYSENVQIYMPNGKPESPTPLPTPVPSKPSLKDFPKTVKRLLKNDVLLLRIASSVLHLLPIAGIYTFLPKYLESQFQLTASNANATTGVAGILIMGAGIFSSSIFMRKFKPSPRFVALWIAFSALIYCFGMLILMQIGCPMNNFVGLNGDRNSDFTNDSSCKQSCSCGSQFAPVCTTDKRTFLSPCYAGCSKVTFNQSSYVFSDCKCLPSDSSVTSGYCPLECSSLPWYILVFASVVLVHSTSEVGSMLLTLRSVEPQDKAMALGFMSFAIGLFGNVPCPIIYGYVVDWSCVFWEETCGQRGACRVYDSFRFRVSFHGLTALIIFMAFLVDMMVWLKASSIKFEDQLEDACEKTQDINNHQIKRKREVNDNEIEEFK